MRQVHIECLPDAYLIMKIGFTSKYITHHQGKSRVFHILSQNSDQLAMVDEDPDSVKTIYEQSLELQEELEGIKYFLDKSDNKIFFLKVKLENWIINICKKEKIKLTRFGLPERPDDLHDVINYKLPNYDKLLNELIRRKNPSILKLKSWLSKK